MNLSFVDPGFLLDEGPKGLPRQLSRLLLLAGFQDIANIDGSGDHGGDVIAQLHGADWVFQSKWKKSDTVGAEAVDEVQNAMQEVGS